MFNFYNFRKNCILHGRVFVTHLPFSIHIKTILWKFVDDSFLHGHFLKLERKKAVLIMPPFLTNLPCWDPGYNNSVSITLFFFQYMSRLMGKPTICICENKDTDQLRGNREADQRLCFRYSDSIVPLLLKSKISSF